MTRRRRVAATDSESPPSPPDEDLDDAQMENVIRAKSRENHRLTMQLAESEQKRAQLATEFDEVNAMS